MSVTVWRFLKLEKRTVTIDLADYPLLPVEQILTILGKDGAESIMIVN